MRGLPVANSLPGFPGEGVCLPSSQLEGKKRTEQPRLGVNITATHVPQPGSKCHVCHKRGLECSPCTRSLPPVTALGSDKPCPGSTCLQWAVSHLCTYVFEAGTTLFPNAPSHVDRCGPLLTHAASSVSANVPHVTAPAPDTDFSSTVVCTWPSAQPQPAFPPRLCVCPGVTLGPAVSRMDSPFNTGPCFLYF